MNDIKQHKVLEAKKIKREEKISSMIIHFDLFNGQVAFVKIDERRLAELDKKVDLFDSAEKAEKPAQVFIFNEVN